MITRSNGQHKVDYKKLHNMRATVPTKPIKRKKRHIARPHRSSKASDANMQFFADQVNSLVVSSMNKRHGMFHLERDFKIDASTANILISKYRLTNKYKPCRNFLQNHSIVDRVYKNEINYTEISNVHCKIRKPREIKYFDANMSIHKLSKQFCFCFKFELTPVVVF